MMCGDVGAHECNDAWTSEGVCCAIQKVVRGEGAKGKQAMNGEGSKASVMDRGLMVGV